MQAGDRKQRGEYTTRFRPGACLRHVCVRVYTRANTEVRERSSNRDDGLGCTETLPPERIGVVSNPTLPNHV